jgi:tRNA (pseudouridine54-N1)-methyltransferase
MVEFIVRARAAPTDAARFRAAIGAGLGVEYLADIIRHSLFLGQGHRESTRLSLVLEKSQDFSRVVEITGSRLGSLGNIHEAALLAAVADALEAGSRLGKEESVVDDRGIAVKATSFEHLVKARAQEQSVFLLDAKGADIRETELPEAPVFVLTDHTPMPKNTFKSMARQGVTKISLGPRILHAAQCVTLIHNELDRR